MLFDMEPTIQGTYKQWSSTGLECHQTKADCSNCTVFQNWGLHKNASIPERRCRQPEANQILLNKGVEPPEKPPTSGGWRKGKKSHSSLLNCGRKAERVGALLRQEIVTILNEKGSATTNQILAELNRRYFLDCDWGTRNIDNHLTKMKRRGILTTVGMAANKAAILKVLDAGKLSDLLRKPLAEKPKALRVNLERR
jgi:hypothetical protein